MVVSSNLEVMSSDDRERFLQLSGFVEELNRRLFNIEELLSAVDRHSETYQTLTLRFENLVRAIQEMENDLQNILLAYGLFR